VGEGGGCAAGFSENRRCRAADVSATTARSVAACSRGQEGCSAAVRLATRGDTWEIARPHPRSTLHQAWRVAAAPGRAPARGLVSTLWCLVLWLLGIYSAVLMRIH